MWRQRCVQLSTKMRIYRFLVRDDMVVLGERDGLPDLGTYDLGLAVRKGASQPALAVADYIRSALGDYASQQPTAVAA